MASTGVGSTQVPTAELASFTRQLGAMLDAGVNVLRALRIASQNTGNPQLIDSALSICRLMEDGCELHQAIARQPQLYGPFFIEMARQGEADGVLGKALLAVADYLDHTSPERGAVEAPVVAEPSQAGVAAATMATLGVLALGAAVIWALATVQPQVLPLEWLGPLAVFWSGVCLLAGAALLLRLRRSLNKTAADRTPSLPPKSVERKAVETAGVVRSALQEQAEAEEAERLATVRQTPRPAPVNPNGESFNNRKTSGDETGQVFPDDKPRFQL
jgi:type II secretion system (T2SS) protein F